MTRDKAVSALNDIDRALTHLAHMVELMAYEVRGENDSRCEPWREARRFVPKAKAAYKELSEFIKAKT